MKPEDSLDYASVLLVVGVLLEILPVLASMLSIVWLMLRIYTSVLDIRRKRHIYKSRYIKVRRDDKGHYEG